MGLVIGVILGSRLVSQPDPTEEPDDRLSYTTSRDTTVDCGFGGFGEFNPSPPRGNENQPNTHMREGETNPPNPPNPQSVVSPRIDDGDA